MFARSWFARMAGLAVLLLSGTAPRADAAFITFTFSGVAETITLDTGMQFERGFDVPYLVTITADTANLNTTTFGPTTPGYFGLNGTVALTGFGTLTFSDTLYVFNNQSVQVVGFGRGNPPISDMLDVRALGAGLDTYGMTTAFGPVNGTRFFDSIVNRPTSGGLLTLDEADGLITFQATLDGPAAATPLPATALVFAPALVGLVLARRRRAG